VRDVLGGYFSEKKKFEFSERRSDVSGAGWGCQRYSNVLTTPLLTSSHYNPVLNEVRVSVHVMNTLPMILLFRRHTLASLRCNHRGARLLESCRKYSRGQCLRVSRGVEPGEKLVPPACEFIRFSVQPGSNHAPQSNIPPEMPSSKLFSADASCEPVDRLGAKTRQRGVRKDREHSRAPRMIATLVLSWSTFPSTVHACGRASVYRMSTLRSF